MSQIIQEELDLDSKCARARPWVRRFMEEYQDGRPWGYAIFEDPTIDDEEMNDRLCRMDMLLWCGKDAVFGRPHQDFPHFQFEYLDWPEDNDEADAKGIAGGKSNSTDGEDGTRTEDDILKGTQDDEAIRDDQQDDVKDGDDEEDEGDHGNEEEDDADIETVRELAKLRKHFKWVRDRAKKRRKAHEALDVDRSGIPRGLLRNVFLVIDQDAIDSFVAQPPSADNAWVWAIDPDYTGDVASMTKNGLVDEYYGYMRVRVQQLVNNFWDMRAYHEGDFSLPKLWEVAKQSYNHAFVSVDPEAARIVGGDMNTGSSMRVRRS